ncbi:hypothetical protein [Corallococcus llansteffanensis]|uniref:Lipoprotein n=1 Tax=Corallococcus llansteffanensis TaxID=2316731 RepID=A0A3A8PZW2_9BACT|nr:hypothetical protein [Corallococcus llansteffanensis]RKH60631.1 hypothetical protein D7V93_12965 [Corallococcus llansteffanensis]
MKSPRGAGPWWCSALLLLLLTACRPVLQVSLAAGAQQLPAPRFEVEDPEHPDRPRYNTVQVLDRGGALFWHLRAEPFGDLNSVGSLTYGEPPSGFIAVEEPRALQPGGRYALFVVGKNRGTLHFDVDAEGHVTAVPP